MKSMDLLEAIGMVDEVLLAEAQRERIAVTGKGRTTGKGRRIWYVVSAAAAILAVSIILPNINAKVAYAMSNLPVVGKYFEVVTFRSYRYESEKKQAEVEVPQLAVTGEGGEKEQTEETVEDINEQIKTLTDELIADFESELKDELTEESYHSLTVTHDVVTRNEKWYTLKLTVFQAEASGWEENHFYTIDMTTGRLAVFQDLFKEDSNYKEVISENIKEQMRTQMAEDDMKAYWLDDEQIPEDNFESITDDVDFYINEQDELVICFNEGDVAPMYMGSVEFVIPSEVTEGLWK